MKEQLELIKQSAMAALDAAQTPADLEELHKCTRKRTLLRGGEIPQPHPKQPPSVRSVVAAALFQRKYFRTIHHRSWNMIRMSLTQKRKYTAHKKENREQPNVTSHREEKTMSGHLFYFPREQQRMKGTNGGGVCAPATPALWILPGRRLLLFNASASPGSLLELPNLSH